jgi:hypothetical protein
MKRTYLVNGRNGYHAVDEHNDQGSGVSDTITGLTRKVADRVAAALNKAYQNGREDQVADSRDLVNRAYALGLEDGGAYPRSPNLPPLTSLPCPS